jgi:hypothetical protein
MVKRRTIVIEPPTREPVTPGYAPSGESAFTRHAAQGKAVDTGTRDRMSLTRLDSMAAHERKMVARLERRAIDARGTPSYDPICVRLQRTRHFLARLEAEQRELAP